MSLRATMTEMIRFRDEAMRRMWKARDLSNKRRELLAEAEAQLAYAQSDYEEAHRQLTEAWPLFRKELEAIPIEDAMPEAFGEGQDQ